MKILITGFEPFNNNQINPSMLVLEKLKNKYNTCLLPVSYKNTPLILANKIDEIKPDLIILLGLADNRTNISLELIGINYIGANIPDNDNLLIKGQIYHPNLPDGLITNIDINNLITILENNNIKANLSLSAGTYLCNLAYFTALNYTKNSLFIHLPNLNNYSLDDDLKAINLIIDTINKTA